MTEVSEAAAGATTRYWCHLCAQAVTPAMEAEIKCPHCDSGFVEEMQGRDFESATSDLRSERALSLWAPILLGMVDESGSGPARRLRRSFRREREQPVDDLDDDEEEEEEDGEDEEEDDEIEREIEDIFRRSRRRSAILQLLESLRDEDRERERERDRDREGDAESLILINSNNQAIILQGNFNSEESESGSGSGLGDYFLGPGLDLLLQHLSENDPNRYGTPPAMKEAVEALPSTKIEVASTCSVCLDDFEIGNEAKELPCRHRFHDGCILPWLELHSTCPVCRFQLPAEETKDSNGESTGEGTGESGSGGPDGSSYNGQQRENRPWLGELISSSDGNRPNTGTDLSEEQESQDA